MTELQHSQTRGNAPSRPALATLIGAMEIARLDRRAKAAKHPRLRRLAREATAEARRLAREAAQ
jgi:hypothetical protein